MYYEMKSKIEKIERTSEFYDKAKEINEVCSQTIWKTTFYNLLHSINGTRFEDTLKVAF